MTEKPRDWAEEKVAQLIRMGMSPVLQSVASIMLTRAYRKGAEEMRERVAKLCDEIKSRQVTFYNPAQEIRTLPLPGDEEASGD